MKPEPTSTVAHADLRFVADAAGHVDAAEVASHGVYWGGHRLLGRYRWRWLGPAEVEVRSLPAVTQEPHTLRTEQAWFEGGAPCLALRRSLRLDAAAAIDEVEAENVGAGRLALSIELHVASDGAAASEVGARDLVLTASGPPNVPTVRLAFDALAAARPDGADWELSLAPGETVRLSVLTSVASGGAGRTAP